MAMKAPRSTVVPAEVTRTPSFSLKMTQLEETMLEMEIDPNKLLKIKGKNKKDVKNEGTSQ